ncbi:HAD-IIB family hydrolase [uncultured Desulfobacter sp.]|uniref:HAD-IIB family hydrolase n=1 Tax=uncultured Desulfobacter sp. TaxID=240139 RepID=UPI0029F57F97|nr:HAD-IIB family hydrolase [uncultured Desulfobacter sp.]
MTEMPHSGKALVFTDLDGTLLDHDTYGFEPALPALAMLAQKKIPVILNSSKTLVEIIKIRSALGNCHPFIAENGSVVAVPEQTFPGLAQKDSLFQQQSGLLVKRLGGDRNTVLAILNRLRQTHGFSFEGFADMKPARLSQVTGLTEAQAIQAGQRLSTEPILWKGSPEQWEAFTGHLADAGLGWVQGGRFISISRPFDKKDGVACLLKLYTADTGSVPLTIGLGDSPNDQAMLNMMDIAVVIRSARCDQITLNQPHTVIRTTAKGPEGWQEAMDTIFNT